MAIQSVIIIDPITDANETATSCVVREVGMPSSAARTITCQSVIRALYESPSATSYGDGSYTVDAGDLYTAVADERFESDDHQAANFTATWPNGDEPDGSTVVQIIAHGADSIGYILRCDDNGADGDPREAGSAYYATLSDATAAAKAYAAAHDEA